MTILTRGFASLPLGSFALSLVNILENIIVHFDNKVKYNGDGHWFAFLTYFRKEN
jgi:hypothetical protein